MGNLVFGQSPVSQNVTREPSPCHLGDDQVIESWPNEVQVSSIIDDRHATIKGVKRVFE